MKGIALWIFILCVLLITIKYFVTNAYKCKLEGLKSKVQINTGIWFENDDIGNSVDYKTKSIKLTDPMYCGFYKGLSHHGKIILLVSKNDPNIAHLHFLDDTKDLDGIKHFEIWELERITGGNDLVDTYNKGCCK